VLLILSRHFHWEGVAAYEVGAFLDGETNSALGPLVCEPIPCRIGAITHGHSPEQQKECPIPKSQFIYERRTHRAMTETGRGSPCPTRVLHDAPAAKDAFGPHQRIASTIGKLIRQEPRGTSIAITGEYGAGKSTVVRFLEKNLADSSHHVTWVFDAWAHEGDPLRRIFLESLIKCLRDSDWVDKKRWGEELNRLAGRKQYVRTRITPRLEPLGAVLGFSLLLFPLGLVLLSHALSNGAGLLFTGGPVHWTGTLGAILAFAPALTVAGGFVWAWCGQWDVNKALSRIGLLMIRKGISHEDTSSYETPEPTSLEFEKVFSRLMQEALTNEERRLVLVIDNLDRVDADEAGRMWATLRAFVDHSAKPTYSEWRERLWLVIPYTRSGIGPPRASWPLDVAEGASELRTRTEGFLDKVVQLRFEVPLPFLKDWRRYVIDLLGKALPEHSEPEFHRIYRLLAIVAGGASIPKTPRELKAVINHIGSLHRQWDDDLPIEDIAYYVILRRAGKLETLEAIISGELPKSDEVNLVSRKAALHLAALWYGVEVETAAHLMLGEPVAEALSNGDGDRLHQLAGRHEYLWTILDLELTKACHEWPESEGDRLLRAALALDDLSFLGDSTTDKERDVFERLSSGVLQAKVLRLMDAEARQGLWAILKRDPSVGFAGELVARVSGGLQAKELVQQTDGARGWAQAWSHLYEVLDDLQLRQEFPTEVRVPSDEEGFLQGVSAMLDVGAPEDLRNRLRPSDEAQELPAQFRKTAEDGRFGRAEAEAVRVAALFLPPSERKGMADDLRARIKPTGPQRQAKIEAKPNEVGAILRALRGLGAEGTKALEQMANRGELAHLVSETTATKLISDRAEVIYTYMTMAPDLKEGRTTGKSSAGHKALMQQVTKPKEDLIAALGELMLEEGGPKQLEAVLENAPDATPLIKDIVREVVGHEGSEHFFNDAFVSARWRIVADAVDDFPQFLASFPGRERLEARIRENGFNPEESGLYLALLKDPDAGEGIVSFVREGLMQLDPDTWERVLRSEEDDELLELTLLASSRGERLELKAAFRKGLERWAKGLAKSPDPTLALPPSDLLECLSPDHREMLAEELVEELYRLKGQASGLFFEYFGSELRRSDVLRNDRKTATSLVEPILEELHPPGLEWLEASLKVEPEIFSELKKAARNTMKEAVRKRLKKEPESPEDTSVANIAKVLGVRRGKQSP
jgi:hypothetical protein